MQKTKSSKAKHDPVIQRIMKNNVLTKAEADNLTRNIDRTITQPDNVKLKLI